MTEEMKREAEQFKKAFPSIDKVYKFFAPNMWGYIGSHKSELYEKPCIMLKYVDAIYEVNGAAQWIVKVQFLGLYNMSMSKEPFTDETAKIAADLFLSRYGMNCSLYMMSLYFANYIMDYKTTYTQFDVQDILRQFGDKFLSHWNATVDARENPYDKEKQKTDEPLGTRALQLWLADAIRRGEDVRNGGLYHIGIVTEKMIAEEEKKITSF